LFVLVVPPGAVPSPYNLPPDHTDGASRSSVPPSFGVSVKHLRPRDPRGTLPPPVDRPGAMHAAARGQVEPLLDSALAARISLPPAGATGVDPSGLLFVPLADTPGGNAEVSGFAARGAALQALVGDITPRAFTVPANDDKPYLRAHAEAFVHALGRGHAVLASERGRILVPLRLSGEATFVREDFVAGYERRLSCAIGSFRLAGRRAMTVVRLLGDGILVLELPRRFVTFAISDAEAMSLRDDTLVGWVGRVVTEPLEAALPTLAGAGMLRVAGEGTVLVIGPAPGRPASGR
jgi:hypothetical protein